MKEKFIEYSLIYGLGIVNGEEVEANKAHEQLNKLYLKIKENNNWNILIELSESSDEKIKYCASVFLLGYDADRGVKQLRELALTDTMIGFSASTTIDMWDKGMMDL